MKDALPAALPGPPLVGNLAEFAGDPLSFFGRLNGSAETSITLRPKGGVPVYLERSA